MIRVSLWIAMMGIVCLPSLGLAVEKFIREPDLFKEQDFQLQIGHPNKTENKMAKMLQNAGRELKKGLAWNITEHFQVGVNRFKVHALDLEKREILSLAPQLYPKTTDLPTARGYGLEFKIKLD